MTRRLGLTKKQRYMEIKNFWVAPTKGATFRRSSCMGEEEGMIRITNSSYFAYEIIRREIIVSKAGLNQGYLGHVWYVRPYFASEQGFSQEFVVPSASGQRHFCRSRVLSQPLGFMFSPCGHIGMPFGEILMSVSVSLFFLVRTLRSMKGSIPCESSIS